MLIIILIVLALIVIPLGHSERFRGFSRAHPAKYIVVGKTNLSFNDAGQVVDENGNVVKTMSLKEFMEKRGKK